MKSFSDIFVDNTKYCTKIKTDEYYEKGKYIIIDQGQADIAGYTDLENGVFYDVPALIFGDHTRIIKYVDKPFFIGADGVKVLKSTYENANYKYLYYALKNEKIPDTGYNRHFKWLKQIKIKYPSKEKQDQIVTTLDTLQSIINHRKQQLEKLDELVKARFVEMFGEVGTDPMGFGVRCLIEVCEINPKKTDDKRLYSSLEVSFVPMPAVTENGSIDPSETRTYDEVKTGFTYFSERDVLFAKITPCMENGKGAVAVGLCNRIGFGSTEFHVLRPIADVSNPYWLYTITSFERFRREAARKMTGSAGQRRVPARFLEQYEVAVPPIALQNQFESFVSQIDKSKVVIETILSIIRRVKIYDQF